MYWFKKMGLFAMSMLFVLFCIYVMSCSKHYSKHKYYYLLPRIRGALYCVRALSRCLALAMWAGGCAGADGRIFALSAHHST